ncbi:hypothetical protein Glove_851g3 [Diversispora epigaea]|uniref:Protein kinase domain-containing protein n=1 Tax=Diversispora epigaea TaxID=1348612 RepID=A0A397G2R2_9GLOM|nr:hypothetical protein Glove_851g3 [Diversispora epigaea]
MDQLGNGILKINNGKEKKDRFGELEVALKKFDNFMAINLKIQHTAIRFYALMVLQYASNGNLREYLKINFNNISWEQKLFNLYDLSQDLKIHKLDIVHQDFHPGNILSSDFKYYTNVSDFGLILSGEEYTKAADVYSFGIIAYEIVTGVPPYPDIPHNKDLAMKICNGLRPKIPKINYKNVTHRPTFEELFANQESTNTTTTPLNYQTHPQAIYTSRLLNYSNLPKPKNEENFERKLEKLTKSMTNLCPNKFCYALCDSGIVDLDV